MADSCGCMAETNTTMSSKHLPINNKFKKEVLKIYQTDKNWEKKSYMWIDFLHLKKKSCFPTVI